MIFYTATYITRSASLNTECISNFIPGFTALLSGLRRPSTNKLMVHFLSFFVRISTFINVLRTIALLVSDLIGHLQLIPL